MRQVGISLFLKQIMEQDPFLQWRERVNVLHIGRAAGNGRDNRVNITLRK
ncbi:hypothetical protein V6M93_20605 [Pectobacterium brasiliense]